MQTLNSNEEIRKLLLEAIKKNNGILRLKATWVARESMPSGKRLGLREEEYDAGERGWICERWLGSTTRADNRVGPPDEGLSYLNLPDAPPLTLLDAVQALPQALMGTDYAASHPGLGRLAKLFDMSVRIAFHFHHQEKDARLVGRKAKEEAYYFPPGVDMGNHPETFFGVHPSLAEPANRELILPHLADWKDDQILRHSRAYHLFPDEGFHVPAGIPHAPGTALTLELQEDSDVFSVLQAVSAGRVVPKDLLFKDARNEDREALGERLILDQIDWELSSDPYFYENRHTSPQLIPQSVQKGGQEYWIFYNTHKFSGKKLVIQPGRQYLSQDRGVYNLLIWQGQGKFGGHEVRAGAFELEELFVTHPAATRPLMVENTGTEELVVFKFFGPDINPDVPFIA